MRSEERKCDCDKEEQQRKPFCAALLLLLVALAGEQTYIAGRSVYSTVLLDVNPGVEITVNQKQMVLGVKGRNADGEKSIAGMNFANSSLEVTVNALIGSMLRKGYLSELANSIPVSVESGDAAMGEALQRELLRDIRRCFRITASAARSSARRWKGPKGCRRWRAIAM